MENLFVARAHKLFQDVVIGCSLKFKTFSNSPHLFQLSTKFFLQQYRVISLYLVKNTICDAAYFRRERFQ